MHLYLEKPNLAKCPKCGKFVLPHTLCQNCGTYKQTEIIDVFKKLTKKERKKKEKEMKVREEKAQEKEKILSMEDLARN